MTMSTILIASLVLAVEPANSGQMVTVCLSSGARITATLLRRNAEGIVLDLGHDVVTIGAGQVLSITRPQAEADTGPHEQGLYTLGRLEVAPVAELVKRYGDAVVVVKTPSGVGSGFIISPQGHLITNYHVIEPNVDASVTLFQRTQAGYQKHLFKRVRILAVHPLRDLALLQIDPQQLEQVIVTPVIIARQAALRVGEAVFTIGNPLGLERSVTQGIVSSTTRTMGHLRFIQTDASINPGNSGGPMFNIRGEIVGVVCAGFVLFDGLAFGIPATDLIDFLEHRDAFLFDPAQPLNGAVYLPPPYREPKPSTDRATTMTDEGND